jgi:5-methylcytosine-specific restriction endonuclease McrA
MKKVLKESNIDAVFSKWIRARDGKCLRCGKKDNLQCAHIFSRTARSVRWEPLNALTLCGGCHLFWAHKNPIEFTEFVQKLLGKDYKKLKKLYYKPKQLSMSEKQVIYLKFYATYNI